MSSHWIKSFVLVAVLIGLCAACFDDNLVNNPSFDLWCGKELCGWQTDEGAIARAPTWHEADYGVSLVETPTQLSQLLQPPEVVNALCLNVDMIADVDTSARARLALDFNDDGIIDFDQAIPDVRWRSVQFKVKTPVNYTSVRFELRKEGPGKVVVAQLRVTKNYSSYPDGCDGGEALKLADGSRCTVDAVCDSGACISGRCEPCARASRWLAAWRGSDDLAMQYGPACGEGAGCHVDAHCGAGLSCVAGKCQSCAASGTCAAFTPCTAAPQCASGACVPRFLPSEVHEVSACLSCASGVDCGHFNDCQEGGCFVCEAKPMGNHCAECTADADCGTGFCTFGVCSLCRTADDCAAGESCRAEDLYDFGPRKCASPHEEPLPRGALCEADGECAGGLVCAAADGEPARCGIGCEADPNICGTNAFCSRPGLREKDGFIMLPHELLPAFEEVQGRVATCFAPVDRGADDQSCSVTGQCGFDAACCDGQCVEGAKLNASGVCVLPEADQK